MKTTNLELRLAMLEQAAEQAAETSRAASVAWRYTDLDEERIKHDYTNPRNVQDWQAAQLRTVEARTIAGEASQAASTAQYLVRLATLTAAELEAELELKQAHAAIHEQTGGEQDSRAIACRRAITRIRDEQIARIVEEQARPAGEAAYSAAIAAGGDITTAEQAAYNAAYDAGAPAIDSINIAEQAGELEETRREHAAIAGIDAYADALAAGGDNTAGEQAAYNAAIDAGANVIEAVQIATLAKTDYAALLEREAQEDAANRDRAELEQGTGRPHPETPDHFEPDPPYLEADRAELEQAGENHLRPVPDPPLEQIAQLAFNAYIEEHGDSCFADRAAEDAAIAAGATLEQAARIVDSILEHEQERTRLFLLKQARQQATDPIEHAILLAHTPQSYAWHQAVNRAELEEQTAIELYYQIRLAGHSHNHARAVSQAPIEVDSVTPAFYELLRRPMPIWSTEDRLRWAKYDTDPEHADRAVSVALLLEQAATGGSVPADVEQARAAHGTPAAIPIDPYQPPAGATAHTATHYQIHQFSRDSFILTLWSVAGEEHKAYRLVDHGRAIFEGTDYRPSPMHAWTTPQAAGGLLAFLTLAPGDTDSDYFNTYTADQIVWCASDRREDLQTIAEDDSDSIDY